MNNELYDLQYNLEKSHWWFLARKNIILQFVSNHDPVLDFGCGTGLILESIRNKYPIIKLYGADYHDKSLFYCQQIKLNELIDLKQKKITHLNIAFKQILCLDVLEHIEDEAKTLFELFRVLDKNGKLIITVPAFQWLWSGEDFVSHHKRRYHLKQIKKLLLPYFDIEKISYFNFILFIPIAIIILIKNLFNPASKKQSNLKKTNLFLNKIFYLLFNLEKYLLRHFQLPFGLSIIVICKRKKNEK